MTLFKDFRFYLMWKLYKIPIILIYENEVWSFIEFF